MRVVIVGGGEVGTHLAERLSLQGWDLVLIESDPAVKARIEGMLDVLALHGSGTEPADLERAGIREAKVFLSVTSHDEVNIVACQLARLYGVPECIARVSSEGLSQESLGLAERLGISMFIGPNRSVAQEIVRIILSPTAAGVADFFGGQLRLLAFVLKAGGPAAGRTLRDLRQEAGSPAFILAAVQREGRTFVPTGGTRLEAEDHLYLLGAAEETEAIAERFGAHKVKGHHVVVVGGGRVGADVARFLSGFGFAVKLIERNPDRCKELAAKLPGILVLQGDGVDSRLFEEENLGRADIFVTATDDEAANLVSATLGKRMGAGKAIALIKRGDMFAPAYSLGVDVAVNARLAVADRILRHLQRDRILSMFTFPGEDVEAFEFVVKDRRGVTGTALNRLTLPEGVLVGAIQRDGKVRLPTGDTELHAGDKIILFARSADHGRVEKLFLD